MSVPKIAGLLLSSAAMVAGHGYLSGAVIDGTYHRGFIVDSYNYQPEVPENIGWAETATDLGFVDATGYSGPDIICHKKATPGAISAEIKAGGSVELQWTKWPESHHGPVITYMANCNGDCSKVDKTTLEFFKIDEAGLVDGSNVPGKWASDDLIAANNSRTVTIPSAIAAGNYVLRHEIIGLHSAGNANGAQNYPQCINLKVTGGGSDSPKGVLGTELYKATDPGILVNIYTAMDSYKIPGPALYTGAAPGSSTTAPAPTTTAAPTTAPTTTASSVSAPVPSSSSSSHPHFTRRPTRSPTATPTPSSTSTPVASTSTPSGPSSVSTGAPDVTETPTTTAASSAAQVTDEPATQTPSSTPDASVTVSSPGQSAQSSVPAGGDIAQPSATATPGSGSEGPSDFSAYLSSLSADKLLEVIRSTMKWLVSDKKVHARALSS
ncbi:Glycoside hydrolase family 61 [Penicillium cf. griseofulvum]|uniref:Glycoside hydrolase family 61 n=1 Tax=Penicillium cf. griseofulvum TaxID=2972120 RepID=A0A9W9J1I7_9EURO|nr:Glycoside hydrolase family 61 [Penicillium cf. griseofulvum]KAJ5423054.1 Glycoside hydrolase family 61 [Penicillium cf. griseofulvum]KAJ5433726.1 Glycoside hydrolase family 61 [Penicillium cf. griseofulvum]